MSEKIASITLFRELSVSKICLIFHPYLYPFLIAAYSLLALLLYNILGERLIGALRAILVTSVLVMLFRLVYRDWHRAALATLARYLEESCLISMAEFDSQYYREHTQFILGGTGSWGIDEEMDFPITDILRQHCLKKNTP